MTEADVWRVIITTLRTGLDANGQSSLAIKQAFQPIKQGADSNDTVYLHKITSRRIGHQGQKNTYNVGNDNFDSVGNYWLEATFQLSGLIARDINNSSSLTSYDIVDLCAAIMQSPSYISDLLSNGIGILRIDQVRNPFNIDDKDQFDQNSSFDFILTYNQTIASTVPIADPIEADIQQV